MEVEVYEAPSVEVLGSVSELTQTTVVKVSGSGDLLVLNGVSEQTKLVSFTS